MNISPAIGTNGHLTVSPGIMLGFYAGVSADVLAVYDAWTGRKRVLVP